MPLKDEILEQPHTLQRLLEEGWPQISAISRELKKQSFSYVFLAARGTSDNAGRYAQYLWGAFNHLPIALATPSLFSLYQTPPRLDGALVVAISQSGRSPDILSVAQEARRQGRPVVAITNAEQSPLSETADFVINILAGKEEAVAATKSYTGELLAIALLSIALSGNSEQLATLNRLRGWVSEMLEQQDEIEQLAQRYRFMEQCIVLGRGFNYATAFEWSLKLKETCYIAAEPYSSADFQHGPVAIVEHGYPVMAVNPSGKVYKDMLDFLRYLRQERHADLLIISDQPEALNIGQSGVALPAGIPEWLTPLVSIIPAQLFCYSLSLAKGFNPDQPRGLRKVTETR